MAVLSFIKKCNLHIEIHLRYTLRHMVTADKEIFYPSTISDWRIWLEENHLSKNNIWVVFHHKSSHRASITRREAVDVALCFGWIDSKKIKIDNHTSHQFFSKRRPKGTWSKINKERVEELIAQGLMHEAGYKCIEAAKSNGSWTLLDSVEELIVPGDLDAVFQTDKALRDYFEGLSRTKKKMWLHKLVFSKSPITRQRYIDEIVTTYIKDL